MKKRISRKKKVIKSERDLLEDRINKLVDLVRNHKCENSFIELANFLKKYIEIFGKKYRIPGCDSDEIGQECLFALRYKAIEDFDSDRGGFKGFALLCIKRHLFSLIKANNQQKRTVLNISLSLDEDRSGSDGDSLSLASLITEDSPEAFEQIIKLESTNIQEDRLFNKLSVFEKEVYDLYMKQLTYEEIVSVLKENLPGRKVDKKSCDNALQRIRTKAQSISNKIDWEE